MTHVNKGAEHGNMENRPLYEVTTMTRPIRPPQESDYYDIINLLTPYVLRLLERKVPNWDQEFAKLCATAARTDCYPDGTWILAGGGSSSRFKKMLIEKQLLAGAGVWDSVDFKSTAPTGGVYSLWYTSEYRESLGEVGFLVAFPGLHTLPPSRFRLDDLQITLVFKKALNSQQRQNFIECLGSWFQSVANRGVLGNGPLVPSDRRVVFRKRAVHFRVNAQSSGQETLNWLLLAMLRFGYEVFPLQRFIFDQEDNLHRFLNPLDRFGPSHELLLPLGGP